MSKPKESIRKLARQFGFELAGLLPIEPAQTISAYAHWLQAGYAGEMAYLKRHLSLKRDPREIFPETRTILCLAINYHTRDVPEPLHNDPTRGRIARYAWGKDYHHVLRKRMEQLLAAIQREIHCKGRLCVDSAPLLEREYAYRAGIGWFGKNTNLIHWKLGSWLFLCEILLDVTLPPDVLPLRGSCGTCTRCVTACPTGAILPDLTLDASRCISYLTIELKGSIPRDLRPQMSNWIFGCDVCQEVCPWNRRAPRSQEKAFRPRSALLAPRLTRLLSLSKKQFREMFRESPILRTKRRGFLRNIAVALGNAGHSDSIQSLQRSLCDEEPLIRGHAAWALGRISGRIAQDVLNQARQTETDPCVRDEIVQALDETDS